MKTTAKTRKEAGQQLAMFNSGLWRETVLDLLRRFAKARRNNGIPDFTMDHFRSWAETHTQLKAPHSLNAWGALPRLAMKAGIIKPTGMIDTAKRPASHGRLVRVWRAA